MAELFAKSADTDQMLHSEIFSYFSKQGTCFCISYKLE